MHILRFKTNKALRNAHLNGIANPSISFKLQLPKLRLMFRQLRLINFVDCNLHSC